MVWSQLQALDAHLACPCASGVVSEGAARLPKCHFGAQEGGCHCVGNAALSTGYQKMCLHFQN